ncbi:dATP/dGTP diphosphohydrolase domain-containing protein [Massilia timonae]|uniref:dATP/dGTP diphosphohydrolase domain-containing protein n=1 Tax=Massilia timonae TaxID=47229 RepID=UPI0028D3976A|nr:dATP/dGTP diphosphohydrolase domain-containing protein [Massilia timonae]
MSDSHEMLTFHDLGDEKPTNPKDMVGVRKAPMSTVPATVLAEIGVAMLEGASKYGRHNYRAVGVRGSIYYDGVMRHLMAWWEGEDIDPDSGMSHVTKAITSLVVLRDAMMQGKFTDDRPPRALPFYPALNAGAADIIDRYADRSPIHYTISYGDLAK